MSRKLKIICCPFKVIPHYGLAANVSWFCQVPDRKSFQGIFSLHHPCFASYNRDVSQWSAVEESTSSADGVCVSLPVTTWKSELLIVPPKKRLMNKNMKPGSSQCAEKRPPANCGAVTRRWFPPIGGRLWRALSGEEIRGRQMARRRCSSGFRGGAEVLLTARAWIQLPTQRHTC